QTYWLRPAPTHNDPTHLGQSATGHSFLAAAVDTAGTDQVIFTGRLSLDTHPWLADHAVAGTVILPGTAHLDLALHAAHHTGHTHIEELTLETPLALPETGSLHLQVTLQAPDDDGRRTLTIHTRPTDAQDQWTQHATGILSAPTEDGTPSTTLGPWQPAGTHPLDVEDLYDRISTRGYHYGHAFRGLTAAWEDDHHHIQAEVSLPEDIDTHGHGIHPALLDAALHALLATTDEDQTPNTIRLPFSWSGVTLHTPHTRPNRLRARLTPTSPDTLTLHLTDPDTDTPLLTADTLTVRTTDPTKLNPTTPQNSLYRLTWHPATHTPTTDTAPQAATDKWLHLGDDAATTLAETSRAIAAGQPAPPMIVLDTTPHPTSNNHTPHATPERTRQLTTDTLHLIQHYLADDNLRDTHLTLLTHNAITTETGEHLTDPAAAALWGLIRTAQQENPGRITLADTDHTPHTHTHLATALTTAHTNNEPQLALRNGTTHHPRLTPHHQPPLTIPDTHWKLALTNTGTIDNLTLTPQPPDTTPLNPGEVRITVHAAGLNFRDIVVTLGMVHDTRNIGGECAGTVTATADDVTDYTIGDRVMGLFPHIAPTATTDQRLLTKIPTDWTYAQAATTPAVFLTAYYALH
ncbi:polyketide synthase dehydratase domain-containing protein, partial [Streptomyces malaysiense]|uniref:polyketide synthase dehydratase domain-containing protein n=1 Tax=Streptomyces malaysiense TaxID=1428626 RepID=UPI00142D3D14